MKIYIIAFFMLIFATASNSSEGSIVYIECSTESGQNMKGSGVIISEEGHVLTAAHVAPENSQCRGSIGRADPSSLLTLEPQPNQIDAFDATILRFRGGGPFTALPYCRFGQDMTRRPILTAGFPGRSKTGAVSYRSGILSTAFLTSEGFLETDSLTAGGMSGGAVLTADETAFLGIVSGAEFGPLGVPTFYAITPAQEVAQYSRVLVEDLKSCSERSPKIAEIAANLEEARARLSEIELASGDFEAAAITAVSISCTSPGAEAHRDLGSGVLIDAKGHIITARHVLGDGDSTCVARIGNSVSADAYELTKRFIPATDADLALLQLRPSDLSNVIGENFSPVTFVRVQDLNNGLEIAAVGYDRSSRSGEAIMRVGVLTDNFPDDSGSVGADLGGTPGFGGAPVFLRNGMLIGINVGATFGPTGLRSRDQVLSSERIADELPNYVSIQ